LNHSHRHKKTIRIRNHSSMGEEFVKAIHELFLHHNRMKEHQHSHSLELEQLRNRSLVRCHIRIRQRMGVGFVQRLHEQVLGQNHIRMLSCFHKNHIPYFQLGLPIR